MNNFDLIAGYEREKEELKKICDVLNNREHFLSKGAKMPKGLIFYGGAGTGKTLFTKVLALECNLPLTVIDFGKSVDDNSVLKQIKKSFEKAKKSKKYSIIFVDELDKILPDETQDYVSDHSKMILTQLLTLIDGINGESNVFFVASCNNYGSIPETMVRPGRIDKKIMLGNPDFVSRKQILELYVGKTVCKFETGIEEIAEATAGFSCAGLETLINECVLESDDDNFVSEDLLFSKIAEINNQDIERKLSDVEKEVISCHNIGHYIVAMNLCDGDYNLEMEKDSFCRDYTQMFSINDYEEDDDDYEETDDYEDDDDSDGDDESDDDSDREDDERKEVSSSTIYYGYDDVERAVTVLFGAMVAEQAVFGRSLNDVDNDLEKIEELLFTASNCGMLGIEYYFSEERNDTFSYSEKYCDRLNEKFDDIKRKCFGRAKEIIDKNVPLLKNLQSLLIKQGRIKSRQIKEIVKSFS